MKKTFKSSLLLLLFAMACGEEKLRTFEFDVRSAENTVNGQAQTVAGATVKVYSSVQAWLDGAAPLKTFTTDDKGSIRTFDKFDLSAVAYAEHGNWNNWPDLLTYPSFFLDNDGVIRGSARIGNSFLSDFESVKNKTYLISDVQVNGSSIFNNVSDCSKDNFVKLQINGKFLYSEGADICEEGTASHEYDLISLDLKSNAALNNGYYELTTDWADVNYRIYINSAFSQIEFRVSNAKTIYTLQN